MSISTAQPNEDDRRYLDEAIAGARKTETAIDGSVFTFLRNLLSGDLVVRSEEWSEPQRRAAGRHAVPAI